MFHGTVHDNIAMGIAGVIRRPEEATREEAENARQASLMHEFIRDLPDGYNTRLGNGGASLGGGLELGFAIARVMLRDPTVLVPGKHTIVCDQSKDYNLIYYNQTKRRLRWTQHTAYSFSRSSSAGDITHHDCDQPRPSQITQNDFVYALKCGSRKDTTLIWRFSPRLARLKVSFAG